MKVLKQERTAMEYSAKTADAWNGQTRQISDRHLASFTRGLGGGRLAKRKPMGGMQNERMGELENGGKRGIWAKCWRRKRANRGNGEWVKKRDRGCVAENGRTELTNERTGELGKMERSNL